MKKKKEMREKNRIERKKWGEIRRERKNCEKKVEEKEGNKREN